MDNIQFSFSSKEEDKGSVFRGVAAQVTNTTEIRLAYKKLRQLYPEYDHLMMAYVLRTYHGWQDDAEYGAGKRILQLLQEQNKTNMVVFVARNYGGIRLGQ